MNIFIGIEPTNQEMRRRLKESTLSFCDFELDHEPGILIESEDIERAKQILKIQAEQFLATSLEGVHRMILKQAKQGTVSFAEWVGCEALRDYFETEAEKYLTRIIGDVVFWAPQGKDSQPKKNGKFNIYLHCSPKGGRIINAPEKIWGIVVETREGAYLPTNQGVEIIDENTGYCVAELIGHNLYIHHGITAKGTRQEISIFAELCKQVAEELKKEALPEEEKKRLRDQRKKQNELLQLVEIPCWNGSNPLPYKKLTAGILAAKVGKVILKSLVISEPIPVPEETKKFHVLLNSAPQNMKTATLPETVWGIRSKNAGAACYAPSGKGLVLFDAEKSFEVAELIGQNLYIFFDLAKDSEDNQKIYEKILLQAVELLEPGKAEEHKKLYQDFLLKQEQKAGEEYSEFCQKRIAKNLVATKRAVETEEQEVESLIKQLTKLKISLNNNRTKIESLSQHRLAEKARLLRDFASFKGIPCVRKVTITESRINVLTDILYCQDPRTKLFHEIGEYLIQIPFDSGNILWKNQTRTVDTVKKGMQAPHVYNSGEACLGTAAEIIPELIANYQFPEALMIAIQFIETVNTNDQAGRYIIRWPVATPELQPKESQDLAFNLLKCAGINPFRDCSSPEHAETLAKLQRLEPTGKIYTCKGECWCLGGDCGSRKMLSQEMAQIMGIPLEMVFPVIGNYFKIYYP